jgi:hypothetical protein
MWPIIFPEGKEGVGLVLSQWVLRFQDWPFSGPPVGNVQVDGCEWCTFVL